MSLLELASTELEPAVGRVLGSLDAECKAGPKSEHDLEVSFPDTFVREIEEGQLTRLQITKKFIVEVKSRERGGVKIDDLRQLQDWVTRELRRETPPEVTEQALYDLQEAALDADYARFDDYLELSERDIDTLRSSNTKLREAVSHFLEKTKSRVKGVLIINDFFKEPALNSGQLLHENIEKYALAHQLAVLSWRDLVRYDEARKRESLDSLNFWCPLFESDGVFRIGSYNWQERSTFQSCLFPDQDLSFVDGPRLLGRDPFSFQSW